MNDKTFFNTHLFLQLAEVILLILSFKFSWWQISTEASTLTGLLFIGAVMHHFILVLWLIVEDYIPSEWWPIFIFVPFSIYFSMFSEAYDDFKMNIDFRGLFIKEKVYHTNSFLNLDKIEVTKIDDFSWSISIKGINDVIFVTVSENKENLEILKEALKLSLDSKKL